MRTRFRFAALALFAATLALGEDFDYELGTWKLNEGKSRIAAGAPKYTRAVYSEVENDMVKIVLEGVDASGKRVRSQWTGRFDGKDYPVTGDPFCDARSYTPAGERTLNITIKKDGQVVLTGQTVVSGNHKNRRTSTKGTDAGGRDISSSAVYEKQ